MYSAIDLAIDKEAADELITRRVSGISRQVQGGSYEYKTPSGMHLATVSDVRLSSGDQGSRLRYRTTILAPFAAHARSKAREIRKAVAEHRVR